MSATPNSPVSSQPSQASQQSVQSPQAEVEAEDAWIDQMAEIDPLELPEQMAESFYWKWCVEGGADNISEAVPYCKEFVDMSPEDHPHRTKMECMLAACLANQYCEIENEQDKEKVLRSAIILSKKLYDSAPNDDAVLTERADNYATLLRMRYSSERRPEDLNKSIELAEEAVATSLQASAILRQEEGAMVKEPGNDFHMLNNLSERLEERSIITGSLEDLERAIDIWTKLVESVSQLESQEARPTWLNNLSAGLLRRYEESEEGNPEDLIRSIKLSREALRSLGDNTRRIVDALCSLTQPLAQRALEADDAKGMHVVVKLLQRAYKFSQNGHSSGTEIAFNLAMRLFQCSQMTSNSGEERIAVNKTAVLIANSSLESIPENHPTEPHLHNLIGLCYYYAGLPQSPLEADSAAQLTLEHLERALNNPSYVPVYRRVLAGRLILRLSCKRGLWERAYEASVKVVNLIPKITSRSIRNADKQRLLSLDDVAGFGSDAAAAALNRAAGDGYEYEALDLLEAGRGLLAASVAELRIDFAKLHQRHSHLADRFVALRDQLQVDLHQQYHVNLDFDALLNEIRKQKDFEDFLGPLRRGDIHDAAADGPVVVLSASEFRGVDAILVEPDRVRVLRLEKVTMEQLEVRSQNLASLTLLEWLWDAIAEPILDALGFTQPPPAGNSFPRIWWIPTGILSRFPFHAAGHHSASTPTVMDRVMSSYSSSIKALLRVRRRSYHPPAPEESKALLVAMTETPQQSVLSHAFKEIEEVELLLKAKSCSCIALSNQPRKERVLQDLKACQIFHFVGHGTEDIFDPYHSALLLYDWKTDPMTVDSVLDLNLSVGNRFMAYLSAYETGQVTRSKFRDESIHLVGAYQLAGFRHVIGTLWSVDDFASVQMASETYKFMLQDKEYLTDESVCRGLHAAAMSLRDKSRHIMIQEAARREKLRDKADARKGEMTDSSEDGSDHVGSVEQFWVPYVHFGV